MYKIPKKREDVIGNLKLIIGVLGALCLLYSIRQYNNFVIIGLDVLLKVYTISGLFFAIIMYKIDLEYEKKNYDFILIFFQKFLTYGSIFTALFFITNEYLSNNREYVISTMILEKKEGLGRSSNSITVNIKGTEKEINIHKYNFDEIKKSNFAHLKLKNGFWDTTLILDTKLIDKHYR
jgi:hypothetical protein